jgi:hypothetical protein
MAESKRKIRWSSAWADARELVWAAADDRYRQLYDKQYKFERNQFINPGEDFTPALPQPLGDRPPRLSNL